MVTNQLTSSKTMKRIIYIASFSLVLFSLSCCWLIYSPQYDPITVERLEGLKVEILILYDSFATESLDKAKADSILNGIAGMIEYEQRRKCNKETTAQLILIRGMLTDHINDRLSMVGSWQNEHLLNNKQNITEAIDGAIETERLKAR